MFSARLRRVFVLCAVAFCAPFHAPDLFAAPVVPSVVSPSSPLLQIELTRESGDEKGAAARVVLRFSDGANLPPGRVRVALYESGKNIKLSEISRRIEARQIAFRVEGDPGSYDVRVLADNRARTPLFAPQTFTLFGILRENGAWLLNGSPFSIGSPFSLYADWPTFKDNATSSAGPLFIAGLKRDLSAKTKGDGRRVIPLSSHFEWKTLRLGLLQNDDEKTLREKLSQAISEASTRGDRNLLGIEVSIPAPDSMIASPSPANATRLFSALRRATDALAPSAAVILSVHADSGDASTRALAQVAALCDAVVVAVPRETREIDAGLWTMKIARRIAEEQPRYDLPIFARIAFDDSTLIDLWMSGATGIVARDFVRLFVSSSESREDNPDLTEPMEAAQNALRVLARNESLFAGSATLEDIGLWPVPGGANSVALYGILRDAGRIPLLARPAEVTEKDARGLGSESLMAQFGKQLDAATIERLRVVAQAGARLYLEGAPLRDEKDAIAPWRLTKLLGFTGKPRENTDARDTLTLTDAWTFGALRGLKLDARRAVDVQLLPPSTASQAKSERGLDVLTSPRIVATFPDGTPAILINPVGKGLVMWAPGGFNWKNTDEAAAFYRAVAAWVLPPQVELQNDVGEPVFGVRAAQRRSANGGVIILSLHNSRDEARVMDATIDGAAGVALDLSSERELPLRTEGYRSTATVSIPANGFALVAFAANRKILEDERNAPRRRARLK